MGGFGAIALSASGATAIAQTLPQEAMFQTLLDVPSNYSAGASFFSEVADGWPVRRQADTSLFEPTLPSLWWSRDQLPEVWRAADNSVVRVQNYRLIRDWTSFHSRSADTYIIDIEVDPQYWNRFNYFQQYAILNQMGTTGMSYGYHVRVYSSITLVGVHACDFSSVPALADFPQREIPVPELDGVRCAAAIGPFIDYTSPAFDEDLFAPP